ncbi:MAG: electron transporter, partial [Arthrobacter sp.]
MSGKSMSGTQGPNRRRTWIIAAAVAAVGLVIGLVLFKPWLLFVDVKVDEQLPIVASGAAQAQPAPPTPLAPTSTPTPAPA